eukprot:TRINITY_DN10579_c0_g1_i1.p1 TRINITY_DN10579_c0_g1~~TRINITY_DN10579_c0_g1_i1.p1  ORF type:complete len:222 (-),score=39.21 TRINITY_DN10579_c0_g1_i1:34-657(-)
MGKTVGGALWLNPEKTSPYDFYQYWRNVDDADVEKCLALLTFLPMDEVRRLGALEGSEINKAKEILAYEVTKLVHGEEEAKKAEEAAKALFAGGADMSNVPTVTIGKDDLGKTILDILAASKVIPSKKEGRRLIEQGGLSINGVKVQDVNRLLVEEDFEDNICLLYTSDAADDTPCVDLGGRRIIKKKKNIHHVTVRDCTEYITRHL